MKLAHLGLLVVALMNPAATVVQDRRVALFSFEDTSCGAWARSQPDEVVRAQYLHWFSGFVSGYNFGNPSNQVPLSAMPNPDTVALYVDKFCRENPLLPFVSAAFQLVRDTRERQNSSKGSPSRK
jgi:hypothetical protein